MNERARLAAALLALALCPSSAGALDLVLDRGFFRAGDDARPPPDDAPGWEPVSLPDRWHERRPEQSGLGWYRLSFELEAVPSEPLSVYVDHLSMNGALWANGAWIAQEGRLERPVAQHWNAPLLAALPGALLRPGRNVLHVQLHRLPHCFGALGPVRIGAAQELGALHAARTFWRTGVARASSVLCGLFAAIMLAFWISSRDPPYGSFAAVCVAITVNNLNFHVRDIPVASARWEALVCSAALVSAACFWAFAHQLISVRRPRLERGVALYAVATGGLFVVDHRWFHPLFNGLGLAALALCAHSALAIGRHTRRRDVASATIYAAVGALALAIVAHDLARQLGWLPQPALLLYPWLGPLLVAGFGTGLTRRFLRAFRAAESQRDLLALRVEEKRAELEQRFGELRALERERLLALERERIMREMHDGVGGHLVRTLAMVEGRGASREELAGELREALDDMRLVIDSLDPSADDLATRLGMLRSRLERSLARRQVDLVWRMEPLPPLPALGTQAGLHVLRIVQEAVTNALRHGGARTLTLTARSQADEFGAPGIAIEVGDDGVGLTASPGAGRGLANMARRAELLGARLAIGPGPGGVGTRVALWIPGADRDGTAS